MQQPFITFSNAIKDSGKLTIICCGNPDRGDDGSGKAFHTFLQRTLNKSPKALYICEINLRSVIQLQLEDIFDLTGVHPTLIIDSSVGLSQPYSLSQVTEATAIGPLSHTLSPSQLLSVCDQIGKPRPGQLWQLAIRGYDYELGQPISEQCRNGMEDLQQELVKILSGEALA
ncbi:MAG: hypothetical protein OQK12_02740 [Motiliproteus sp.]|nr:hypothetical protein [Motiliproteus sp.]MCW9053132.1 hypothetical protein [Motiliproteus sp.]